MAAKDALKHWRTLIDQALLKEEQRRLPNHPSVPAAAGDTGMTRHEAGSPPNTPSTLLAEDVHLDETDTTTLRHAIQSLHGHASMPIDTYTDIYALIAPTDIQITSPHTIAPALLQPFETGAKKVMLIFLTGKKIIPATVYTMHRTHMFVDMNQSSLGRRLRERLLVLFPALPERRYVLQAVVDEIYASRLKLRYQDPRYDLRWQFPLPTPILLHLVHPTTVNAMAQEHARLIRDTHISPLAPPPAAKGSIADRLYQQDTRYLSPHMRAVEETPPMACRLYDISPGGICLTVPEEYRPEELLQRVARLQITLPSLAPHSNYEPYFPFVLEPFGVIRHVQTTARPWLLHVRFLKRLPQECNVLFEYVAQHYEAHQTPQA